MSSTTAKIPGSAVEMAGDLLPKLDVQFGNLEFCSDSASFALEETGSLNSVSITDEPDRAENKEHSCGPGASVRVKLAGENSDIHKADVYHGARPKTTSSSVSQVNHTNTVNFNSSAAKHRQREKSGRSKGDFVTSKDRKQEEYDSVGGRTKPTARNREIESDMYGQPKSYKGHGKRNKPGRKSVHKAQRCNKDGLKEKYLSCNFSSDECKDGENEISTENEEISTQPHLQDKNTDIKNGEVDGGQLTAGKLEQGGPKVSQEFREKGPDNKSNARKVIGFPFLRNLIGKDASYIVSELTKTLPSLKDCIVRTSKEKDFLEVFIQVIAEAFKSRSMPLLMIRLFETLRETGFFDTVMKYIVDLLIKVTSGEPADKNDQKVLQNIVVIIMEQTIRNPASLIVFARIHALLGQVINALDANCLTDVELKSDYRHLTEHKQNIDDNQKLLLGQYDRNPPNDFRQYPVSPCPNEITGDVRPFLRQNKTEGEYENLEHYLDVQFRLLREDFVGPLREGMADYIKLVTSEKKNMRRNYRPNLSNLDIKVYENVRVHSPVVTEKGLCYKLQLELTERLMRTKWKFSKRLIYGSMVCLTDKNFNDFFLATVVEREEKDIKNGFFVVHFEQEELQTHDVLHKTFRMAETTGYFESYRHVLSSLQSFKDGDLPFEKYIVGCQKEVDPPAYLSHGQTYDLRPLVDNKVVLQAERRLCSFSLKKNVKAKSDVLFSHASTVAKAVPVTNHNKWPSCEILHMDDSQFKAVQTALSNELAIIQGPPGTGKTYIGLQIVKALLHNKSAWAGREKQQSPPMLIVCYTNHALDQFLEGIVKFFKGDVLRVGGRSSSTILEQFNLKRYRSVHHGPRTTLGRLQVRKRQILKDLENQSKVVQAWAAAIQVYRSEIVTETFLLPEMGQRFYNNLVDSYRGKKKKEGFTFIGKWLGLKYIQEECMKEVLNGTNGKRTKLIRVEDDATRKMRERMIDIDDEVNLFKETQSEIQNIREEQVAFYVPNTTTGAKERNTLDAKMEAKYLKHLKSTIIAKISDEDIMNEEEAKTIKDMWRLNHHTKWRLYRLWIRNLCTKIYDKLEGKKRDFEEASERYQEALAQEDREIMKQAAVIGMTTSGAARYQSVLRDIGPRIIVVEEAAEVLEAHIITTLSKRCEHLILIGDHKQLRPNPSVYKLAVKYKLDVSFFERMVKNEVQFNCLELQHRMRPEISSIMRHIYPGLKDHEHVHTYPNVKGISTDFFLINHTHSEHLNKDIKSYSNQKEAEYAVALCRYLLLQGYGRHQITMLTTYTGQLMNMRLMMPKEEFDGVKLTVVDNYQGEENEIVILSLVRSNNAGKIGFLQTENRICVALSRAKVGFYILGNFNHLAAHSPLWKKISEDMKERGYFGEGLKLYCQNHPDDLATVVKSAEEFKKAPEGGCSRICEARLQCGHKCEKYCHILDKRHETTKCQKACTKTLCEFKHKCPDKCYMKCRPCRELVTKTVPDCGHSQEIPCAMKPDEFSCRAPCEKKLRCGHQCKNTCGNRHTNRCLEKNHFTWPCGHSATIKCWEAESKACPAPCETILKCEHICSGTCGACFNGRIHQACRQACGRILVCGHQCKDYCDNCPPCTEPCKNRCIHSNCPRRCGERCAPCKEPCAWKCSHYKCTRLCSEPCNRFRCNRPCPEILDCKHKCIGLCGEPCPKLCRICDKEKVTEIFFGDEDEPNATFVLLEDCGHIFETRAMDKYMSAVNEDEGIQLKCCPLCKTPIRKCLRYGKIVNRILKDIERVKKEIIGNFRIFDTVKQQVDGMKCKNRLDLGIYADIETGKLTQDEAKKLHPYQYYTVLCQKEFNKMLDRLKESKFYTEKQLRTIQNQQRMAVAVLDVRQKIECSKNVKTWRPKTDSHLISILQELLPVILLQRNCLTEQEIEDFTSEIERGNAFVKLLKLRLAAMSARDALEAKPDTKADIARIEQLVLEKSRFTVHKEEEVQECFERVFRILKIEGPCITENERLEIVRAMGLTKGHWFKCPNNHIYAIGECGGATQRGTCPECKANIGGENHRLTDGNKLAREMDGAEFAAYSEEANNMANFDLNNLH